MKTYIYMCIDTCANTYIIVGLFVLQNLSQEEKWSNPWSWMKAVTPRSLRLLLILTTRGLHMKESSGVLFQLFLGFPSGTFWGLFSLSHFLFIFLFIFKHLLKHCKHRRLLKHRAPSSISPQSTVECLHALKTTVIYWTSRVTDRAVCFASVPPMCRTMPGTS